MDRGKSVKLRYGPRFLIFNLQFIHWTLLRSRVNSGKTTKATFFVHIPRSPGVVKDNAQPPTRCNLYLSRQHLVTMVNMKTLIYTDKSLLINDMLGGDTD